MSLIDPTKPVFGDPTTQSVRDNFTHARDEIDANTAAVAAAQATASAAVTRAGDTMTGRLTLAVDPTNPLDPVTLQYFNAHAGAGGPFLPLTGGTVTGALTVTGTLTASGGIAGGPFLPLSGGTVTGATTFSNGIQFGSLTDPANNSAVNHIWLFGTQYGIGITNGRLNLISGGSTVFVSNANDVFSVNNAGMTTMGISGNYLRITPNNGTQGSALTFENGTLANVIQFLSPLLIPQGVPINLTNTSHQIRGNVGQDGASMSVCNISMNSWNGIGFGPNIGGQNIPQYMYSIALNVRSGTLALYGDFNSYNAINNSSSNIKFAMFQISGTDQQIRMDGNSYVPSAPVVAAGGTGWAVNDRAYDAYSNTYTVTAVSSGAVTALSMNAISARIGSPPANPVALTAAPGFTGTGLTINLTWTAMTRLVLSAPTLALQGTTQLVTLSPLILNADPTAALGAATKQYVDARVGGTGYLPTTGGTLTGGLSIAPASGTGSTLTLTSLGAASSQILLQRPAGQNANIVGYSGTSLRWSIQMPDNSAEGGSNAGSNFNVVRYSDAGAVIDTPLSIIRSSGAVAIKGTQTNDNASVGNVGESIFNSAASVSLTNATTANITTISLTAGDWDVRGQVQFSPAGSTTMTSLAAGISQTSAVLPNYNTGSAASLTLPFTAGAGQYLNLASWRISLAATTTIYLVANAGFAVSTMQAFGYIAARRVR